MRHLAGQTQSLNSCCKMANWDEDSGGKEEEKGVVEMGEEEGTEEKTREEIE